MSNVEIYRQGPVERWALNRPRVRNALNPDLVGELRQARAEAERSGVRTVVLSGNGPSFCAGADLSYLRDCAIDGRSPRPFLAAIGELTVEMESSPIVFVAALHGHAVAGGLELALACDIVLAAAGTLIGDGHILNNLVPGGGASFRLNEKLGSGMGTWLALSGALLPAEHLSATGWLHAVVSGQEVGAATRRVTETLSQLAPAAQARMKSMLTPDAATTRELLSRELDVFEQHWRDEDIAASLGAFLSRRELNRV